MIERQIIESNRLNLSRRQALVGTGSLAISMIASPAWAAQPAPNFGPDSFTPYIGQGFLVTGTNLNVALQLVKVESYQRGRRPASLPDPFSLIFRAVSGTALIPAGLVSIEHAAVGTFTVYLNPISKQGNFYEVAFN